MHEARAKSRDERLVSRVSKHFSTRYALVLSCPRIGKPVGASTTCALFEKRNRTPAVTDVDVESPREPHKRSGWPIRLKKTVPLSTLNKNVTGMLDHKSHA